jgi:hypothetical protein
MRTMFTINEFFKNYGRETCTRETAVVAAGSTVGFGTFAAIGIVDTTTAVCLGLSFIAGHIQARAGRPSQTVATRPLPYDR